MEYFVSTENTTYYHWQLELLIESFKHHNCHDNLLVALAENQCEIEKHFSRNIVKQKDVKKRDVSRVYGHDNIGRIRGFNPLNELYSMYWSLQYGMLQQPFAWIKPHMVLKNQIRKQEEYPSVTFSFDPFFTFQKVRESIGPFWEWVYKSESHCEKNWIPAGSVFVFNKIPVMLFERVIVLAEALATRQLADGKEIWNQTTKLAWILNLLDFVPKINLSVDYHMTENMLGGGDIHFVDYDHGLPPVFNKSQFSYAPPACFSFGDPIRVLSEHAPSPNSHYMSELAKINLQSRS